MELIKVEKVKQDEQVAIILKESQRQKQEKDVNEQLYSELESMKVENTKLTKSIDDLKNDSKAK